jgi:Apea-like HEPN
MVSPSVSIPIKGARRTMSATPEDLFSIAMFPYLKTFETIQIGPYLFRSTDDLEGLSEAQSTAVSEVTAMLYAQNNLRVRSASYAVIPQIHVFGVIQIPEVLKRLHSFITYMYGTPNEQFGDPFLRVECATLLVLTPNRVPRFLIEPEHHTILDDPLDIAWDNDHAPGYDGMLDLTEPFWVVKGSRIYPPVQHITLNISQNLAADCNQFLAQGTGYELVHLLTDDKRHTADRVFTALNWYNATNRAGVSESEALVHLAIAFESLLDLPTGEKTDRFVDSVSLLLGRVPRLKDWVRQFYDARSQVAHQGKLAQGRFVIQRSGKPSQHLVYHPLLVFGREIFRLCVAAITHGAFLAESRDIAAKLKTNGERFEELCAVLEAGPMSDPKQALEVQRLVSEINRYRFVGESGLAVALIIGTVQRAAKNLLSLNTTLAVLDQAELSKFAEVKTKNEFAALEILMGFHSHPPSSKVKELPELELIVWQLIDIAWMYTFQSYFRMQRHEEEKKRSREAAAAIEETSVIDNEV